MQTLYSKQTYRVYSICYNVIFSLKKFTLSVCIIEKNQSSNLYSKADGVEQDEEEHEVFEQGGVDHLPRLVLPLVGGNVPSHRFRFQRVLDALSLCIKLKIMFQTKTSLIH